MKNNSQWILIALLSLGLVSCEIKEELYLQNDGSGEYTYSIQSDFSSYLKGLKSENSEKTEEKDTLWNGRDFMKMAQEKLSSEDFATHQTSLQNSAKILQEYRIREFETNEEKGMVFSTSFSQLNELQDGNTALIQYALFEDLVKNPTEKEENKKDKLKETALQYNSTFAYQNNVFTRTYNSIEGLDELKEKDSEGEQFRENMFGMLQIKSIYHFPRRIVSCSYPNAQFSLDGKTMYIDNSILELFLRDKSYTLTVTLEEETP